MSAKAPPLLARIWLSWACFFRIWFDADFAARIAALRQGQPESEASAALPRATEQASTPAKATPSPTAEGASSGALQLLALLQREGRFVDFVQQDIVGFSDVDVGAAARVVHEGCRRVLQAHAAVASVRSEAEGAELLLERASDDVKLTGNVRGTAPFRGVLRHRGWRVEKLTLPTRIGAHDPHLVAPAELELS